jgi:ATP/maltotriose-dependent transcriptional regulator MalT
MLAAIGTERSPSAATTAPGDGVDGVRKLTVETRDEVTAQEEQIAGLARDGPSNPEIGAPTVCQPAQVEWHLKKVFTKLGIRSRDPGI